MSKQSIADTTEIEFVVSKIGNAMLVHVGPLDEGFRYVQYDTDAQRIHFYDEAGDMTDLGFPVQEPFQEPLHNTKELICIELDKNHNMVQPRFLRFNTTVGG